MARIQQRPDEDEDENGYGDVRVRILRIMLGRMEIRLSKKKKLMISATAFEGHGFLY
jgi:hypothetical protein